MVSERSSNDAQFRLRSIPGCGIARVHRSRAESRHSMTLVANPLDFGALPRHLIPWNSFSGSGGGGGNSPLSTGRHRRIPNIRRRSSHTTAPTGRSVVPQRGTQRSAITADATQDRALPAKRLLGCDPRSKSHQTVTSTHPPTIDDRCFSQKLFVFSRT